ncbi:MAG: DNA polymerase III subunit delta' [Anaerolineae bacterium]|nr:DNA polymerase III subunit delta' [Anaerolineae bacterium]
MWSIVGHEWAVDLLAHSIASRRLSHAYLFVGPDHVGKRTLARAFAQAILCTESDAPCGVCRACRLVEMGRHPDVHVVEPEEDRIKIEAIRSLLHAVALSPIEGAYRICLISHFDRATASAANALLKTLEEPPETVILLLTASSVESLLPTIVSRCQVVPLRALSPARVSTALRAKGLDEARAQLLAHVSRGRIGWALAAAADGQALEVRASILDQIAALSRATYVERFAWAEQLSRQPEQVPTVLETMVSWWRDVLLLASGSSAPIANIDRRTELDAWASRYGVATARQALHALRETAWGLDRNANLRLALEVLALELPNST